MADQKQLTLRPLIEETYNKVKFKIDMEKPPPPPLDEVEVDLLAEAEVYS